MDERLQPLASSRSLNTEIMSYKANVISVSPSLSLWSESLSEALLVLEPRPAFSASPEYQNIHQFNIRVLKPFPHVLF